MHSDWPLAILAASHALCPALPLHLIVKEQRNLFLAFYFALLCTDLSTRYESVYQDPQSTCLNE